MSACSVFALFLALSGSAWDGNDEWPGSCCHRRSQFCANCSEAIIRVSQTWHPDTHQSPGKTDDADVKKLKTPNPEARMVTSVYHIWSWPGERLYNAMRQISLLIIQVVITINIHDCVTLCWQAHSLVMKSFPRVAESEVSCNLSVSKSRWKVRKASLWSPLYFVNSVQTEISWCWASGTENNCQK